MRMNVMKGFMVVVGVCGILSLFSCGDDDHNEPAYLAGKYWYINDYLGDKLSYTKDDGLKVLRFENSGALTGMDYSGRRDYLLGTWSQRDKDFTIDYNTGHQEDWYLLKLTNDELKVRVNGGDRTYRSELSYLKDLKADAFLVNEYVKDGLGYRRRTHVGGRVCDNVEVREAVMIFSPEKSVVMKNKGIYWSEPTPGDGDFKEFDGTPTKVRFYFRIGSNNHVKLDDSIYTDNVPNCRLDEFDLRAIPALDAAKMVVKWAPLDAEKVFYRVELFDERMKELYFSSNVQLPGLGELTINSSTAGEVNRMSDLKRGSTYTVRLTSLIFEPGMQDFINNKHSSNNVQALTYVEMPVVWQ